MEEETKTFAKLALEDLEEEKNKPNAAEPYTCEDNDVPFGEEGDIMEEEVPISLSEFVFNRDKEHRDSALWIRVSGTGDFVGSTVMTLETIDAETRMYRI